MCRRSLLLGAARNSSPVAQVQRASQATLPDSDLAVPGALFLLPGRSNNAARSRTPFAAARNPPSPHPRPANMAFVTALALPARAATRAPATSPRRAAPAMCAAEPLNADGALPMKEMYDLAPGKKAPVCRCWKSKKHPLCDGSHNAYNKETGAQLGPLVVSVPSADE